MGLNFTLSPCTSAVAALTCAAISSWFCFAFFRLVRTSSRVEPNEETEPWRFATSLGSDFSLGAPANVSCRLLTPDSSSAICTT